MVYGPARMKQISSNDPGEEGSTEGEIVLLNTDIRIQSRPVSESDPVVGIVELVVHG